MNEYSILAAVDLGSNSFKLQVARVVDDQIYPLDVLKEPVRLAAGVGADKNLDAASQQRALDCLRRFGERLRGMPQGAVRCVGTSALRVADNAAVFLAQAEIALGYPIEVIAGREEARLVYIGVAHSLPSIEQPRLVIDIGGGSTECIIGAGYTPRLMESLHVGCVNYTQQYFADGHIDKAAMKLAELAARAQAQTLRADYAGQWHEAVGSSGTARALSDVLVQNGWAESGISASGLAAFRTALLRAGSLDKLELAGLKADRKPVIAGGLAIMSGMFAEFGIEQMTVADGALREGVLYDLLGRFHHRDMRAASVAQFMRRYHVDTRQAKRVATLAALLYAQIAPTLDEAADTQRNFLLWAAQLHEIGISIAHSGYHKHGAYILENADMPGFSRKDQVRLALLVRTQRGGLAKLAELQASLAQPEVQLMVLALRLAVLFHRSRINTALPDIALSRVATGYQLALSAAWLDDNPLTCTALKSEMQVWKEAGVKLVVNKTY
jgi:exopolyphosphatase/guanosine-5'-triphosphate,3'-diphosphate pyrophosphatase